MHTGYITASPEGGILVVGPSAEGHQSPAEGPWEVVQQSPEAVRKAVGGPSAWLPSQRHGLQAHHGLDPAP